MEKLNNWAYSFALNHSGAGVGKIYYSEKYFNEDGIVNPATGETYTDEEISTIKNNAVKGNDNYFDGIPANAIIGMNVLNSNIIYWYNEENSNKIVSSANPLSLDKENGNMLDANKQIVATPIK